MSGKNQGNSTRASRSRTNIRYAQKNALSLPTTQQHNLMAGGNPGNEDGTNYADKAASSSQSSGVERTSKSKMHDPPSEKKPWIERIGPPIAFAMGIAGFFLSLNQTIQGYSDKQASERETWRSCYLLGKRLELLNLYSQTYPEGIFDGSQGSSVRLAEAISEVEQSAAEAHVDIKPSIDAMCQIRNSEGGHSVALEQDFEDISRDISVNNGTQNPDIASAYFGLGRELGQLEYDRVQFDSSYSPIAYDFVPPPTKDWPKNQKVTMYFFGEISSFNASDFDTLCTKIGSNEHLDLPSANDHFPDGNRAVRVFFPVREFKIHPPIDNNFRIHVIAELEPGAITHAPILFNGDPGTGGGELCDPDSVVFTPDGFTPQTGVIIGQTAVDAFVRNLTNRVEQNIGIPIYSDKEDNDNNYIVQMMHQTAESLAMRIK
jgi:hypothetical protein